MKCFLFDVRYNDYIIDKKTATTIGTGHIRIKYCCRSIRFLIVVAPFPSWLLSLHSFPDCCRLIHFRRVNYNLTVLNSKERSIVSLKPALQWELRNSSFALALVEMVCTANYMCKRYSFASTKCYYLDSEVYKMPRFHDEFQLLLLLLLFFTNLIEIGA